MMKRFYTLFILTVGSFLSLQVQAKCHADPHHYGSYNKNIDNDLYFCTPDVRFSSTENVSASSKKLLLASGARDNLPQNLQFEFQKIDDRFFPFGYGYGYSVGLSLMMHLDRINTVDNYGIYKINEYIGLKVTIGDPSLVRSDHSRARISLERGIKKDLAFGNNSLWYTSVDSLGLGVRIKPVLLKEFPAGTTMPAPGVVKVATVYMRKQIDNSSFAGNYPITGDIDADIWLDLSGFTLRSELKTCSLISNPNVTLTFPSVGQSSFPNLGSLVYGASTNIQLDCSQAGNIVTPYAVLYDVQSPNNRSDELTIETGTGKATGIKIKLFKDNDQQALRYGPQSSLKNTENWWQFSNRGIQYPSVRLTGYYVRTGTITPGDVSAQATITFSYQ